LKTGVKNVPVSVRARLLNRAKAEKRQFSELIQYYAMERFLFRLSRSDVADDFVLKGGLMLQMWGGELTRSTKDIDLHMESPVEVDEVKRIVTTCFDVEVTEDGIEFDRASLLAEPIRLKAHNAGVRLKFEAGLSNARIPIQIDVGFGDVITPEAARIVYPTLLLDFEAPELLGYTPETAIAEKFEAMVVLDMANTRLKDFWDIYMLAQTQTFDGAMVARAVASTFARRRTSLPTALPIALTPAFSELLIKQTQWISYLKKSSRIQGEIPTLADAAVVIAGFLMPVVDRLTSAQSIAATWHPGGPWIDESGLSIT
jgi:predicted nucleotidyltransferase component of viral defense system